MHDTRHDAWRYHLRDRIGERIGNHVDADALIDDLITSLRTDDGRSRFVCIAKEKRRAIYSFPCSGNLWHFVIDRAQWIPLTVLPRGSVTYTDKALDFRKRTKGLRRRKRSYSAPKAIRWTGDE